MFKIETYSANFFAMSSLGTVTYDTENGVFEFTLHAIVDKALLAPLKRVSINTTWNGF